MQLTDYMFFINIVTKNRRNAVLKYWIKISDGSDALSIDNFASLYRTGEHRSHEKSKITTIASLMWWLLFYYAVCLFGVSIGSGLHDVRNPPVNINKVRFENCFNFGECRVVDK